ncbi:hypothetical protein NLX83_27515 [Allokutzneria sp. A3M-2-11 16]|uniref:hypothetical protein n=1 Tax=Allokutzneria sp. A3M-2-11 16 TaxID=2962043 RepID=UPI0020B7CDFF|nr:hypothetical protein [Allokutzneria sp. A3M-2-11 16]MCP3803029.1 hypothetical protein [Allokutzneria sp. A3M-2-11 16]
MSSVPLWVPIVVGLLGLVGALGAQFIGGWREDRRWRREVEREDRRWEREREARRYEARSQAYAELVGAIEAFDWVLYQARKSLREKKVIADDVATELRAVTTQARNSLGGVNVHAPEKIRSVLRESMIRRSDLSTALLASKFGAEQKQLWDEAQREYRALRRELREDLGLDTERLD